MFVQGLQHGIGIPNSAIALKWWLEGLVLRSSISGVRAQVKHQQGPQKFGAAAMRSSCAHFHRI